MALCGRAALPLPCLDLSTSVAPPCRLLHPAAALVRVNPPAACSTALSLEVRRAAAGSGASARLRGGIGEWNLGSLRGGGTGLLERPSFDQSQFDPIVQVQEGGDFGKLTGKKGVGGGDNFRVLLIDDARHTETLVEKALPQAVPSITASDARNLFHESRQNGLAVVIVTVKEHAEFYAQMMVRHGLQSFIEPVRRRL